MLYKETEFQDSRIGKIPKDWKAAKLTDVADYINGYAFSPEDWKSEGLPIIRIQNLNDPTAEFNFFDGEVDEQYLVKNGDLLFAWSASIGCYLWNRGDAWLNQHIFKVVPKQGIGRQYLYYALFMAIEQLLKRVHGSTMKHFKRGELKTTLIPLPLEEEQKAVVGVLGVVDSAILKVDEVIWKTERLKKGLMQQLLTRGIGHKEYKDTPKGKIPKEWEVTNLGSILTLQRGYDLPISKRLSGRVPVVGSNGIAGYHNRSMVSGPGVMVGRSGSIGKVYYIEEDYWPLNTCLFVKEFKNSYPKFVYYLLQKMDLTRRLRSGTSVPTLNRNYVHPMKTAIPSDIREQQTIADILSAIDRKLEFELKEKIKLERIKQGLMDLLLTGKIRIKVD